MAEDTTRSVPSGAGSGRSLLKAGTRSRQRQKQRGSVTAVDTDGRNVWVVEATVRGSTPVITSVKCGVLAKLDEAGLADAERFGAAISKTLGGMKGSVGSAILCVPPGKQLLRNLAVPMATDIRETASMVRFQVARDLPFPADDAVIDFFISSVSPQTQPAPAADKPAQGGSSAEPAPAVNNVLAVAVRRETITHCEKLAQAAGIKLRGLGMRADANCRCISSVLSPEQLGQSIALVSLSREGVQIDVFHGREVLFTRTAPLPEPPEAGGGTAAGTVPEGAGSSAAAPTREMWINKAVIETVRCLHGHSGNATTGAVGRVLVAGVTGFEGMVREALGARLTIPCEPFDPGTGLGLRGDSTQAAAGAVTAIGLALSALDAEGLRLDFLNPKRPAVQRDMRRIRILGGIALAAAAFLMLVAVRVHLVKKRTVVLRQLEAEVADAEKKRSIYRAMKQQAATVAEWTKNQTDWLEHYAYLSAVLPSSEDVYLTSISANGSSGLRLAVQARGGEILARLDKQLRAAGYEVKPLAVNPGADRHGYDFRSTVELVIPPKMKPDLSKVRAPARPRDDASLEPGAVKGARP